jgi:hypothetical protein
MTVETLKNQIGKRKLILAKAFPDRASVVDLLPANIVEL